MNCIRMTGLTLLAVIMGKQAHLLENRKRNIITNELQHTRVL